MNLLSEAEDRGWSVVITMRIWDQWRHSGVSRRENPPCFWQHSFMPSTSSRYIKAQWSIPARLRLSIPTWQSDMIKALLAIEQYCHE